MDVFYDPADAASAAALDGLVSGHADYLRESLGVNPRPAACRAPAAVVIASERTTIGGGAAGGEEGGAGGGGAALGFTAVLATPAATLVAAAALAACGGDAELAEALGVVLASR